MVNFSRLLPFNYSIPTAVERDNSSWHSHTTDSTAASASSALVLYESPRQRDQLVAKKLADQLTKAEQPNPCWNYVKNLIASATTINRLLVHLS
jgi:hypothetical protein